MIKMGSRAFVSIDPPELEEDGLESILVFVSNTLQNIIYIITRQGNSVIPLRKRFLSYLFFCIKDKEEREKE